MSRPLRPAARVLVVLSLLPGCGAPLTTITAERPPGIGRPMAPPVDAAGLEEAMAGYERAIEGGLTDDECREVVASFEALGRYAAPIYMAGATEDACGHPDRAHERWVTALEIDPTLCEARVALGVELHRDGRLDAAREAFETAVDRDPRCAPGYVNLAILMRSDPTTVDEALANLRRALAIEADSALTLNQLALLYFEEAIVRAGDTPPRFSGGVPAVSGENDEIETAVRPGDDLLSLAEVVLRQAELVDPSYAPLYNTWGLVRLRQGDIVAAARRFAQATELDPSSFEAFMNLGELTLGFRGYDDALRAFTRAVELAPRSYDALLGLGAAHRGLGHRDEARAVWERALALDDARPDAYFDLALLDQDFGDHSEPTLRAARARYEEFVAHAAGAPEYAEIVDAVTRTCTPEPESGEGVSGPRGVALRRAHRRWERAECRPGRIQQIDDELALSALMASGG